MKLIQYIGAFTLALIVLISCQEEPQISQEQIDKESTKFNNFLENQFQNTVNKYPEFQTRLGINRDADKWNDISPEFEEKRLQEEKEALQWVLDSVSTDYLDEATLLSYNLFRQKLENSIADYKFRLYTYPVEQMHGMQAEIPAFLINSHQIKTVLDAENYVTRLHGMKALFEQLSANLIERQEAGIMPPKFVFDRVLTDCYNIIKGAPFDKSNQQSTLLEDFVTKVEKLDTDDFIKKELIEEAEEGLLQGVLPAYQILISTLEAQREVATTDDGVWKFPNAEEYFKMKLQRTTTTNLTSDEIHEIGLSEVARIHGEMTEIKNKVGFEGSLQEFFEFMRTDKQFYYPDTEEGKAAYLAEAVAIIDSMKTRLDELFIVKPKADIYVKAVEAFREQSAGKAFYQRPAADGSRPGIYYANLYKMEAMPTYQMEALAYHEGIPGHHMQLAIQQELQGIPNFRKFGGYTAYTEGWGLYTEFLPKELGFYSDPYSDFGRLAMELWRACRLVVDTGIHTKKWTREEGIKYYMDNTPNAEIDAVKMVERHIVMPSQATAYKIGMIKIIELREMAREKLGDKFDIRKFHQVVLSNGAIPLNVLEDLTNKWIAEELETPIKG